MTWFDEVRPAFLVSQGLGLLRYTFVAGIPAKSRMWQIYASIQLVLYLCDSFDKYAAVLVASNKWTSPYAIMMLIGAVGTASTFAVHSLTVSCSFDKMKTLFDAIKEYDRTIRIDFTTKSLVVRTWVIFFLPTIFFVYLRTRKLLTQPIFVTVIRMYFLLYDMAWYGALLKFVILVNAIERRLKHLYSLITADTPKIMYDRNDRSRPLRLNDTCRLHDTLVSAANILNSIYDKFLPLWIVQTAVYTITRIYSAIDAYEEITFSQILAHCLREIPNMTSLLYCFTSCYNINVAANKIGSTALSPKSWLLYERFHCERDKGFIIGQHFALQPFHCTAGYELFVIDLSFLGSVLAASMTVLVILSA